MRIIEHQNWGHGLRQGTDHDINCTACLREHAEGVTPAITGEDTTATAIEQWRDHAARAYQAHADEKVGDATAAEREQLDERIAKYNDPHRPQAGSWHPRIEWRTRCLTAAEVDARRDEPWEDYDVPALTDAEIDAADEAHQARVDELQDEQDEIRAEYADHQGESS